MARRFGWSLRWRLSLLWFLEWGITGAVMTYLPIYWDSINLTEQQQSQLYAVTAAGLWVAPFVVGQIADRWLAIEKLLAICHFIGGAALYMLAAGMEMFKETGSNFESLLWLAGIFAVAYLPTMPLVSTLCFRHMDDPDSEFGKVRVWGTVGWIAAGLTLSFWLARTQVFGWLGARYPEATVLTYMQRVFAMLPAALQSDCFRMSALLSFALSSFCVFLPHTPPARAGRGRVAPLALLSMFRNRTFSLFMGISFLLALLVVPLYNMAVPPLLESLGIEGHWVPTVMLIGQISEFPALLLLSFCLRHLGLKATFGLGIAAWAVRYALFSLGTTWPLVLSAIALHGVCHVFLIVVAQLYIDSQTRQDLRASAQNLLSFITLGIGMPLGALLGGWLRAQIPRDQAALLFAIPAVAAIVLLALFWKAARFPALPEHGRRDVPEIEGERMPI